MVKGWPLPLDQAPGGQALEGVVLPPQTPQSHPSHRQSLLLLHPEVQMIRKHQITIEN